MRWKRKRDEPADLPIAPAVAPRRATPGLFRTVLLLLALAGIAVLVVPPIVRSARYRPTSTEVALREARAAEWHERWIRIESAASYVCAGAIALVTTACVVGLWLGYRWIRALIAQQEEVRAHDGVFPLIVRKAWTWARGPGGKRLWPTQIIAVIDPNKNPAPVMVIGPEHRTGFELPETIPPDQRAVTHGAQVVQATAASKGGAPQPQLASFLDQVPQIPAGLMAGQNLPEIEIVDSSHFHRLLDDAGLLEEDQHLPEE